MNQIIKNRIEEINSGRVPEGYKQTPFGIFPCDWESVSLGSISLNKGAYGLNAPACEYSEELPKYIRITDINENGNYVDTGACVDFQDDEEQYSLKEGDIVFARTGATVGRNYLYKAKDGKLLYAGFLIKYSLNQKTVNPYLVYANCNTRQYWDWVKMISARSGQPGINAEEYCKYKFIVPSRKFEQGKIAEILMKWDEMVELQEQYIKKLEELKSCAINGYFIMQDDWEEIKLDDILVEYSERVGNRDIIPVAVGVKGIRKRSEIYDKELSDDYSQNKVLKENQLCFGIGTNCIVYDVLLDNALFCVSPAYKVFNISKKVNPYFLKCLLDFYNRYLSNKYMIISARQGKSVEFSGLLSEKLRCPDMERQKSIVESLKSIDNNISLQKEKLDKIKTQRKILQQYLLTGIVRVV